ncbi:MAG: hypothetical protein KBD78_09055 [Oligoflexales bacterium]|nr:hypothetical protein [Oligoflexales bacterium]
MKRSVAVKFPNSVELFKFCQKILSEQRGFKVHDQEVGSILEFNPSDCSHWKRGEKNVRSVFALARLAEILKVEEALIHDIASSAIGIDEGYFEFQESNKIKETVLKAQELLGDELTEVRARVDRFVSQLHAQCEFSTPPLYLPEILRFFSFISTQPTEMIEKLSRILRLKPGKYSIHFRKGDLKPQTRMSMTKDLARILFEGERTRFPELKMVTDPIIIQYEILIFAANLLVPKTQLVEELAKVDARKNIVSEMAAVFWVPKTLVGFQIQDLIRHGALTKDKLLQDNASKTPSAWQPLNAS